MSTTAPPPASGTPESHDVVALGRLVDFLDRSPSPFHVVQTATRLLTDAGFTAIGRAEPWLDVPTNGLVAEGGALIAWRLPSDVDPTCGFRLIGAHTDSPGLRIKPRPDQERFGWRQLGVEVYGGVLVNSWLDRDLGIAGRVLDTEGEATLVAVHEPVARIPQLAIHLDRGVNDQGLRLDPQQHLTPVWGSGSSGAVFSDWIAGQAGIDGARWWDLCLFDVQPAAIVGADRSLLASGRLDNQVSCWAAIEALIAADDVDAPAVVVLNDHEEVGSASTAGASGPLLEQILERLVSARGGDRESLLRALGSSRCVSADNAHAIHPNYPERHEPDHRPEVNAGPAIKLNANQRYATSADTAQHFERACRAAGVPWQVFVSRNNMPCGSTIGPLTATRLGIPTVDVGVPQLAMHSARELCGAHDPVHLRHALVAHLRI